MKKIISFSALLISLLASAQLSATPVEGLPAADYSQSSYWAGHDSQSAFNGGGWNSGNWGTQWLQVDLGSAQTIDWVSFVTDQSPNDVTWQNIYISDSAIGNNWGSLSAVASRSGFSTNKSFFQLNFAPTSGRYLEVVVNSGASWTALSDVQVGVPTSVPEPAAVALFGLGLFGLFAARRRKQ